MDEIKFFTSKINGKFIYKINCWICENLSSEGLESSINDMIIFECNLCEKYLAVCGRCNHKLCIDLYPADFNIFLNPLLNELYNNFNSYHLNIFNLKNVLKNYKCNEEYENELIDFFSKKESNRCKFYRSFSSNDFKNINFYFDKIEHTQIKDNSCDNIPYWKLNNEVFEIDTKILGDIVGYNCQKISRWNCKNCNDYFYFKI